MLQRWAIIDSTYINAYSIIKDLKKEKFQGKIICFKSRNEKTMIEKIEKSINVYWVPNKDDSFINKINEIIPKKDEKIIFFTHEKYMSSVKEALNNNKLTNCRAYIGSKSLELILNKFSFYKYLSDNNLAEVPLTIGSEKDPWGIFKSKFILRMKNTFNNQKKLPRVKVISNVEELDNIEKKYIRRGFKRSDWCYQEVLSLKPKDNLSVCGWHSRSENQYAVTRKVLQHPDNNGNGDICEVLTEFPTSLISTTSNILNDLEYEGPFELEFVYDENNNIYKVIELNPRFWMQNSLFNEVTDNYLIKKHLGLNISFSKSPNNLNKKYWINTNYYIFRLFRLELGILRYFNNNNLFIPGFAKSIKWAPTYLKTRDNRGIN